MRIRAGVQGSCAMSGARAHQGWRSGACAGIGATAHGHTNPCAHAGARIQRAALRTVHRTTCKSGATRKTMLAHTLASRLYGALMSSWCKAGRGWGLERRTTWYSRRTAVAPFGFCRGGRVSAAVTHADRDQHVYLSITEGEVGPPEVAVDDVPLKPSPVLFAQHGVADVASYEWKGG